ncbi:MAG: hypothetical protein KIH71_007750 [Roseobacter sp.]|nr:hypothetical protein [Roseobacter sp.]
MTEAIKFSLSLDFEVYDAIAKEAATRDMEPKMLLREIIVDFALKEDLLPVAVKEEILLYRDLCERAASKAVLLEYSEDIVFKTIVACENDPSWMADYTRYIGASPYSTNNPKKQNINPNISYRIKIATRSDIVKTVTGTRKKRNVTGQHIISSYSLFKRRD